MTPAAHHTSPNRVALAIALAGLGLLGLLSDGLAAGREPATSITVAAVPFAAVLAQGEEPRDPQAVDDRPGGVTHVRIEGALDAGTLALLRRGVESARANGHDTLVLELDTPGGEIELLWKLVRAIDKAAAADLMLVAWVHDRALSAGVLVALACEAIYMSETATIGASAVVTVGPQGMTALPEEGEVREKIVSYLRAEYRNRAESRGRLGVLAEAMVDYKLEVHEVRDGTETRLVSGREWDDMRTRGEPPEFVRTIVDDETLLTLGAREALGFGFSDGMADSLDELVEKVGQAGTAVATLERARSEELLALLDQISGLLLALGLFFGYAELKAPGFGLPGALAIACFVLLVGGRYLVGLADVPEIVMIAAGAGLIAVEIFLVPGTLWAGIAGGALVIGGLVLIQLGPGFGLTNPLDRKLLFDATFRLALTAAGAAIAIVALSRFLPETPILRRLVLDPGRDEQAFAGAMPEAHGDRARFARVGAEGVARTDLRPVGKVVLDADPETELESRAEGEALSAGDRVRVVEVVGGRLVVVPKDPPRTG